MAPATTTGTSRTPADPHGSSTRGANRTGDQAPAPDLASRRSRLLASLGLGEEPFGWTVVFAGPRAGYLGLSDGPTHTITIYVRAGSTDQQLRVTLAHELGHAYDGTYGTAQGRADYLAARGATGTAWYPCGGCSDYASGAGDYAEVFAVYLAGSTDFRSTVAARPTRARAAELVRLVTG